MNEYEFFDEPCDGGDVRVLKLREVESFSMGERLGVQLTAATVGWYKTPEERELLRRGALVGFQLANDGLLLRKPVIR